MEMVTTRITEALPITKPRAVRKLRNLLAFSACRLKRSDSPKYIEGRAAGGSTSIMSEPAGQIDGGTGCQPARGLVARAVCADWQSARGLATCPTTLVCDKV